MMTSYKEKLKHITTFIFDYDGVLTDGTVLMLDNGEALRSANVKDGYALQLAVKKNYNVAVISGGKSSSMSRRLDALNVKDYFLGVSAKREIFNKYLDEKGLSTDEVLFMGDDIPDYDLMKLSAVSACPADASEEIKSIADYISDKAGGKGCVRDIIEQVLKIQAKWFDHEAFQW
jgi:3-deoxy-D-manno-octulosonate 8-phosphate phosphatase (KDO 8-P phosphatase)